METLFMILAVVFAVVMLILMPKYAKFINQQPKMRMEQMRKNAEKKEEDEENA